LLRLWKPKKRHGTQEWADKHVRITGHRAHFGGRWKTKTFPYEQGIFWLWDHPYVEEIDWQAATQLGKTEIGPVLIMHAADNDPGPAMYAGPDRDSCQRWERERFYPMAEESRSRGGWFRDYLMPQKLDRRFSVIDLREMLVFMGWAGSIASLGEKSIRYLIMSELDKWQDHESKESDSEPRAMSRIKAWPNAKVFKESTPTMEGRSRINNNLKSAGVVLKYHVPCPLCGEYQILGLGPKDPLKWGLKWPKGDKGQHDAELARKGAYYNCRRCFGRILDRHRTVMLERGVWAPEDHKVPQGTERLVLWGPGGPKHKVGLQLSSFYSPLTSWGKLASAFISLKDHNLQNWKNEWEGETWDIAQDRPIWTKVRDKIAATEPRSTVPKWAHALTAGIDCHGWHKGNFYVVRAWGIGGKSQLVEAGNMSLPNEPNKAQVEAVAAAVLDRSFEKDGGGTLEVALACIDAGWGTEEVYDVCRQRGAMKLRPVKGSPQSDMEWWPAAINTNPRTGEKYTSGFYLFHYSKKRMISWVNARLFIDPQADNAWLLHADPSEEYVRAICNVVPVPRKNNQGYEVLEYHVIEEEWANHYHDAEGYAELAAAMAECRNLAPGPAPVARRQEPRESKFNRRGNRGFGRNRR